MGVLSQLGCSDREIGRQLKRSHRTIRRYLDSPALADPTVSKLVEKIREKELADLTLIGQKARMRIHEIFDTEKPQLIPAIAAMDRSFQQRQLLSGGATQNISLSRIVAMAHELDVTPGAAALTAESSDEQ